MLRHEGKLNSVFAEKAFNLPPSAGRLVWSLLYLERNVSGHTFEWILFPQRVISSIFPTNSFQVPIFNRLMDLGMLLPNTTVSKYTKRVAVAYLLACACINILRGGFSRRSRALRPWKR